MKRWLRLETNWSRGLFLATFVLVLFLVPVFGTGENTLLCGGGSVSAQPAATGETPVADTVLAAPESDAETDTGSGTDNIKFYAFLEPNGPVPQLWQGWAKEHRMKLGFRPMLQWHFWANKRKPFIPSMAFIFLFSVVASCLAPKLMDGARTQCREKYWRSFFTGVLVVAIVLWLVRMAVLTKFGWPMGVTLAGLLQVGLMCGIGVTSALMGDAAGRYVGLDKWCKRDDVRRFAQLLIGAALCALLLQIPGVASLPRFGTRLVGLLALLGFGAIYRARMNSQSSS